MPTMGNISSLIEAFSLSDWDPQGYEAPRPTVWDRISTDTGPLDPLVPQIAEEDDDIYGYVYGWAG